MNWKQNCLSYWYPKIVGVVPTPETIVCPTNVQMTALFDGKKPDGWDEFIGVLGRATDYFGYPCFLRTGHTSGKHDWKDTCFVPSREALESHVTALVEYSEMTSLIGLPYNVWVVRKMLPTKPLGTAFKGMPICKEFRVFVRDGDIQCWHPYWPANAFKQGVPEWYNDLCELGEGDQRTVFYNAVKAGKAVGGHWSVDLLKTNNGWYVTDMATAEDSWHWPECQYSERERSIGWEEEAMIDALVEGGKDDRRTEE